MQKRPAAVFPTRLALEPRIVFDAAVAATVADRSPDPHPAQEAPPADAVKPAHERTHLRENTADHRTAAAKELIFIDAAAQALEPALQGIRGEIIRLDPQRDGVQQILQAVAGRSGITAIHLLGHGDSGEVQLGSTVLDATTLRSYATELAAIGTHLTSDADLLIYGCRVAEGSEGQRFIERLSRLTRADIAASVDDTGAASQGGNWVLESATGPIESKTLEAPAFDGLLAMSHTAPTSVTTAEEVPISFNGSVSVSGYAGGLLVVQVRVNSGTLNVDTTGMLVLGGANGSNRIDLGAFDQNAMNAALSTLSYTPLPDFAGSDTLTITSQNSGTTVSTVGITVTQVPDILQDDTLSTTAGTPITANLLTGTNGATADTFTGSPVITAVTQGTNGSVSIGTGGEVTYTPNDQFVGTDSFSYTVTSNGTQETGTVNVDVTATAGAPVNTLVAGPLNMLEDDVLPITASVADPDGDVLATTVTVSHGTLEVGSTGGVVTGSGSTLTITGTPAEVSTRLSGLRYTPTADYHGDDQLQISTSDATATDVDSVDIAIGEVADAMPDSRTTSTAISIDVLSNDKFTDPSAFVSKAEGAALGTVTVDGTNSVLYTPNAGAAGQDTFTYTVTAGGVTETGTVSLTVEANATPVVTAPAPISINEDGGFALADHPVTVTDADGDIGSVQVVIERSTAEMLLTPNFNLIGADTGLSVDPDLNPGATTYTFTGTQANLVATLATMTFTAAADYNGSTSLKFVATDGMGQSASSTATVVVAQVDDTPDTTLRFASGSVFPLSVLTADANLVSAFSSDSYASSQLGLISGLKAGEGTSVVDGGAIRVSIDPAFAGTGTITYYVDTRFGEREQGTVTLDTFATPTITAPPTATITQGQTLQFDDLDTVSVVDPDGDVNTVDVSVDVGSLQVTVSDPQLVTVSGNGGSALHITGSQDAINATLQTLRFTPPATYTPSATLSIVAMDADGQANDTVAITIDVAPITLAAPDSVHTNEDAPYSFGNALAITDAAGHTSFDVTVSANAGTIGGDSLFTGTQDEVNAFLAGLQYVPPADYDGDDVVTIRLKSSDDVAWGGPTTVQETVTITMDPVPDATNDTIPVTAGTSLTFNVLTGTNGATPDTFTDPNAVLTFSAPGVGTLEQGATLGEFTFTPPADFQGATTFTYTVRSGFLMNGEGDPTGGHDETATVTLVAKSGGGNTAPVNTVPGPLSTLEDKSLAIAGLGVTDADGDALSTTLSVSHGTLSVGGAGGVVTASIDGKTVTISGTAAEVNARLGQVSYGPAADYYGVDTLQMATSDGVATDMDTIALSITSQPDIAPDTLNVTKGGAVTGNLLANDSFSGKSLTVTATDGKLGTVTVNPDNTVTYTHTSATTGSDTFTYTVDSGGVQETATVTVNVKEPVANQSPVNTVPGSLTTKEDVILAVDGISVADANSDALSTTLSVTHGKLAVSGAGGIVTVSPDGRTLTISGTAAQLNARLDALSYTPDADYNGLDTLQVSTSDGLASDADSIKLSVTAVADIVADKLQTTKGGSVIGDLLANDSFKGTSLTLTVTQGTLGTVVVNKDNTVTYTHTSATVGTDTFTYTVDSGGVKETATVTVDVRNGSGGGGGDRAPVNTSPGDLSTNEDTPLDLSAARVSHVDGTTLTSTLSVTHGKLSVGGNDAVVSGDGTRTLVLTGSAAEINSRLVSLRYTPDADYNGADSFRMASSNKSGTDIDVSAIAVKPVADIVADAISTRLDTPVTVNVITEGGGADNFEDAGRAITSVTQGAHGSVAFEADGRITYTPATGYVGGDSFTYTVTSGGVTETTTVTVSVTLAGAKPVNTLGIGTLATDEDTTLAIGGLSVADPDSNMLTSALSVAHGTLVVDASGAGVAGNGTSTLVLTGSAAEINAQLATLRYRPVADYNGDDTLTLATSDGTLADTDTAAITVRPVADIVADALTTASNTPVTANVITQGAGADNFEDPARAITAVTQGAHGSVSFGADGMVTYTPQTGYAGTDSFTYTVTAGGVTETATVSINVEAGQQAGSAPVNTLPGTPWALNEDTSLALGGLSVSDADGDTLTTILAVGHGKLSVDAGGKGVSGNGTATLAITGTAAQINSRLATLRYTPTADYNGADSLRMSTTDASRSDVDIGTFSIQPVPDIAADLLNTDQDTAITANLLTGKGGATADNFEGSPVISAVTQGANGKVTLGRGGQVSYVPNAGFSGTDTFTYTVRSGGVTETATVTVIVDPAGDGGPAPTSNDYYPLVSYVPPGPLDNAEYSPVREIRNLVYVQPVVRGEPLPTDSRTPVQDMVRALQDEALMQAERAHAASHPEAASPLFDAFGLSAPRTEFISPVQQATPADAPAEAKPAEQKTSSDMPRDPSAPQVAPQSGDIVVQATPRSGAPSFSAQLQRSKQMLRTSSMRDTKAATAAVHGR